MGKKEAKEQKVGCESVSPKNVRCYTNKDSPA